jgi:hypothetical protein
MAPTKEMVRPVVMLVELRDDLSSNVLVRSTPPIVLAPLRHVWAHWVLLAEPAVGLNVLNRARYKSHFDVGETDWNHIALPICSNCGSIFLCIIDLKHVLGRFAADNYTKHLSTSGC